MVSLYKILVFLVWKGLKGLALVGDRCNNLEFYKSRLKTGLEAGCLRRLHLNRVVTLLDTDESTGVHSFQICFMNGKFLMMLVAEGH